MPPTYPPQLYPHSKAQLQQILTDYYSLTLQLQTLQRHILKIQTENQRQHRIFKDEVEKLKLYIDQCENQIKKREERELVLIQRLKELEISRYEEIEELKFSRNSKKANDDLIYEMETIMKEKQTQWNAQKVSLIKDNQFLMRQNVQFTKEIAELQAIIQQLTTEKSAIAAQLKKTLSQLSSHQPQIIQLTQSLQRAESTLKELQIQNQHLKTLQTETERLLQEKQKILPISSSCSNCLKLNKMHEIEIEKKTKEIQSLKKDVQCLLAFFEAPQ